MEAIDEILTFLVEIPDEVFTPARVRFKDLTEQLQKAVPMVHYEVSHKS